MMSSSMVTAMTKIYWVEGQGGREGERGGGGGREGGGGGGGGGGGETMRHHKDKQGKERRSRQGVS